MCLSMDDRHAPSSRFDAPTRRALLQRLTAIGLSVPAAMAVLQRPAGAAPTSFLDEDAFLRDIEDLLGRAGSAELASYRLVELGSEDMPWKPVDLELAAGQEVTFLLGGRIWLSREHDLWFEPGTSFNVRSRGKRPIWNPMNNTGTMTTAHDGSIEIARGFAEWASEDGDLWTPEEAYKQLEVRIYGVALAWKGKAVDGLKSLRAHGDVGGILDAEIGRLESPKRLPEGWQHIYMADSGALIFSDLGDGQIGCQPHKNAGILERSVDIPLEPGTTLSWRWMVEELPSLVAEDQLVTHDYLSIGAQYDDGQDLTYIWSRAMPVGNTFRCPFPRWTPIETHMVVRSGIDQLGQWLAEERDLHADYQTHIGGPATKVVRVWLLGVSVFQRRVGTCRFAEIAIRGANGDVIDL